LRIGGDDGYSLSRLAMKARSYSSHKSNFLLFFRMEDRECVTGVAAPTETSLRCLLPGGFTVKLHTDALCSPRVRHPHDPFDHLRQGRDVRRHVGHVPVICELKQR